MYQRSSPHPPKLEERTLLTAEETNALHRPPLRREPAKDFAPRSANDLHWTRLQPAVLKTAWAVLVHVLTVDNSCTIAFRSMADGFVPSSVTTCESFLRRATQTRNYVANIPGQLSNLPSRVIRILENVGIRWRELTAFSMTAHKAFCSPSQMADVFELRSLLDAGSQ
jgi:hypothetical protein